MANLDILTQPFPADAVKERTIGGGFRASYVDGITVIRRLNEATGNDWNFSVDRYWIEGNLSYALVTLELPGHGSRQHIGVQTINDRSGEDAVAKGAITDGLKKAATLFGVAAELYGPDYEFGGSQQSHGVNQSTATNSRATDRTHTQSSGGGQGGASPRQLGLIRGLAREKGVDPDAEASKLFGVSSLDELSGGSGGTASQLIDHLQNHGDDNNGWGENPPGWSLSQQASAASDGMNEGATKYWIARLDNAATMTQVDQIMEDAYKRFGGSLSDRFIDAVSQRTEELRGGG